MGRVNVERADIAVARLAERQRGVVHRRQLVDCGVHPSGIDRRIRAGRLHPVLPQVFAVGHRALPSGGSAWAAVLWRGPASVLSHHTAAWIHGLHPVEPQVVHVTSPAGRTASRTGWVTHRSRRLDEIDVRTVRGLRVTRPARTLLDIAELASGAEVDRAIAEARVRRLVTADELRDVVARHPGRRGGRVITTLLEGEREPAITRSEAERRLLHVVRRAGLPFPRTNVRVVGYEVDAFWPDQRVVVEVDGYAFHRGRRAFEQDRRKAATLETNGYRVLRVSWRQITESAESVAALLAAALAAAS